MNKFSEKLDNIEKKVNKSPYSWHINKVVYAAVVAAVGTYVAHVDVKETRMFKTYSMSGLRHRLKSLEDLEKLKGDQHELDTDKDGDIDAKDFDDLRTKNRKKKKDKDEGDIEMNQRWTKVHRQSKKNRIELH